MRNLRDNHRMNPDFRISLLQHDMPDSPTAKGSERPSSERAAPLGLSKLPRPQKQEMPARNEPISAITTDIPVPSFRNGSGDNKRDDQGCGGDGCGMSNKTYDLVFRGFPSVVG